MLKLLRNKPDDFMKQKDLNFLQKNKLELTLTKLKISLESSVLITIGL